MSIENKKLPPNLINSKKFAEICDLIYSETVSHDEFNKLDSNDLIIINKTDQMIYKTVTYRRRKFKIYDNSIIFCHLDAIDDLFFHLKNKKNIDNLILITNQTDQIINRKLYTEKPSSIRYWYSTNVDTIYDDLLPIPLGIANEYAKKNISESNFLSEKFKISDDLQMYINFRISTNYRERTRLIRMFKNLDWVKIDQPELENNAYHDNLIKSQFVLCPWGNGVDTHRFWETLYSGSIPITKYHETYSTAKNLPVLFVNSYKDITISLLKDYISNLSKSKFSFERLDMNFWENEINKNKVNLDKSIFENINESKDESEYLERQYISRKRKESNKKKRAFYINKFYKIPTKLKLN